MSLQASCHNVFPQAGHDRNCVTHSTCWTGLHARLELAEIQQSLTLLNWSAVHFAVTPSVQ